MPNFYTTHVVYAVPGKGSSCSYTAGNSYGSTTSLTESFMGSVSVTTASIGKFLIFGEGGFSLTQGHDWGSTTTTQTDIAGSYSNTYKKNGDQDYIDHDDDEIWFLVAPVINVTITPANGTKPQIVHWEFSPGQPQTTFETYARVGWLRNPSSMPTGQKLILDSNGITSAFYPELLKADPFVGGVGPNPAIDPARFVFVKSDPYLPPLQPGYSTNPISDTFSRSVTNSTTQMTSSTWSSSITLKGNVDFFSLLSFSLQVQSKFTWTSSSNTKTSTTDSTSESITIQGPSYGYTGPTLVRIYEDTIWKTYFFTVDYY